VCPKFQRRGSCRGAASGKGKAKRYVVGCDVCSVGRGRGLGKEGVAWGFSGLDLDMGLTGTGGMGRGCMDTREGGFSGGLRGLSWKGGPGVSIH
jgi:hypothetical protein